MLQPAASAAYGGDIPVEIALMNVPRSFLGTAMRPTLLQRFLPGYPTTDVPIEAAGFLGFSWTALVVVIKRWWQRRVTGEDDEVGECLAQASTAATTAMP